MKRSAILIFLLCFLSSISEAQLWKMKRLEAVACIGPTVFFGDVGGFSKSKNVLGLRDMSFLQTRYDVSVGVKYRITSDINARVSFSYGLLHATDERGSNEMRGFEASVSFFEPALIGEYYIFKNKAESSYLFSKGRGEGLREFFSSLDVYAFTGIGGLNYSVRPNEKLKDKMAVNGSNPGGFTAIIPVGIGTSLVYTPEINFGVELGGRYTFSDNLDGYTSQYSSSNDVYYFFNFTFTYKLETGKNGLPIFKR